MGRRCERRWHHRCQGGSVCRRRVMASAIGLGGGDSGGRHRERSSTSGSHATTGTTRDKLPSAFQGFTASVFRAPASTTRRGDGWAPVEPPPGLSCAVNGSTRGTGFDNLTTPRRTLRNKRKRGRGGSCLECCTCALLRIPLGSFFGSFWCRYAVG
jgi:hypothetical protein